MLSTLFNKPTVPPPPHTASEVEKINPKPAYPANIQRTTPVPTTIKAKIYETVNGVKLRNFPKKIEEFDEFSDEIIRGLINHNLSSAIKSLLIYNLGDETVEVCSEEISTPYVIEVHKDKDGKLSVNFISNEKSRTKDDYTLAVDYPLLRMKNLETYLQSKNISIDGNIKNSGVVKTMYTRNTAGLEKIVQEFKKCNDKNYFMPVSLIGVVNTTGHQNLLVFDKTPGEETVTWIEPQFSAKTSKSTIILTQKLISLLLDLFYAGETKPKYKLDAPSKNCPQAITEDTNCMFWTLLLTMTLIENPGKTIDEVSDAYITKYPTKESLNSLMNDFKFYFYHAYLKGKESKSFDNPMINTPKTTGIPTASKYPVRVGGKKKTRRRKLISRRQTVSKSSRNLRTGTSKSNTYH